MRRPRLTNHLPQHQTLAVGRLGDPPDDASVPFVHPHSALALYERGAATFWCGSTYKVKAGDVLLIPEGMPHYLVHGEELDAVTLAVCTSCLTSPAGQQLAALYRDVYQGAPALRRLATSAVGRLRWALKTMEMELEEAHAGRELAIDGCIALIVAALMRSRPEAQAVDEARAVGPSLTAKALSFITRHASEGISLVDVAKHVRRSPAQTATTVKSNTGQTVGAWIAHARLATARQLLLTTDDTVETVAARVGFASASHFHRVFRRAHHTTPGRWRAAHSKPLS